MDVLGDIRGIPGGNCFGMYHPYKFMHAITFSIIVRSDMMDLQMVEMASMAPTAGGQYHWVSEFSPKSAQRLLSYIPGEFLGLA